MIRHLCLLTLLSFAGPAAGQTIVISMQASAEPVVSSVHRFGVYEDALTGWDAYDVPLPPSPPTGYIEPVIVMPSYPGPLPNRWLDDFHPTLEMEDEEETWIVHLESDQAGRTALLSFAAEIGADLPLAVTVTPDVGYPKRGSLPAEFEFTLTEEPLVLNVTLHWDDPTPTAEAAWGEVKSIYDDE